MINNDKRNEIIRVFRKFARLGLANCELNPIQVYKKIDVLCTSRRSMLDMFAVFDTLRLLALDGEDETIDAIYKVYFSGKTHRLTGREMSERVSRVADEYFCDDRTVYRRLEKARAIYERIREREGLILDGEYSSWKFEK